MSEFHMPAFTGEVTLTILNFGQQVAGRGVLFTLGQSGVRAIGQFGVEGGSLDSLRRLSIPADEPSILTEVIARKVPYHGPLGRTPANQSLIEQLGGEWPETVIAAPLLVSGRVLLILYADRLLEKEPIGPAGELELVMLHAGLAMERSLLARRVEHLENLQEQAGEALTEGSARTG